MHRVFYWKRFLLVLGITAMIGVGILALHRVQVRRQLDGLRVAAENAEVASDPARRNEVIDLYARYLRFQRDEAVAEKYANLLLDQFQSEPSTANAKAAIWGVEESLLKPFPNHPDVRRRLAELYIRIGRVATARDHLEMMLDSPTPGRVKDVEVLEMASACEVAAGNLTRAIDRMEEAVRVGDDPGTNTPLDVRVRLRQQVLELHDRNRGDGARERRIRPHLDALASGPFKAHLGARVTLARFQTFRNELGSAAGHLKVALEELGGDKNAEALVAAGELEVAFAREAVGLDAKRGHLETARRHLERAHGIEPKNPTVNMFYADALDKLGERARAVDILKTCADAVGPGEDQFRVLIDRLIDLGEKDVSAALVARLTTTGADHSVEYFNGRLAVLKEHWAEARTLLEGSAPYLTRLPEFHKRAMAGLARVYEVMQNPDRQYEYYKAALADPGPILFPALVGEADALVKLGRTSEAIDKYHVLVTAYQAAALRPILIRLRLQEVLGRSPERRDWGVFDSDVNLGPPADRTDEIQILHATSLALRGERARAVELLEGVTKKEPASPKAGAAWATLARLKEAETPGAAAGVLKAGEERIGTTVELRLARADLLVFRAKPPAAAEFEALAAGADGLNADDRYRLAFGLGQAALAASPRPTDVAARKAIQDVAIKFLREAGRVRPRDLQSRAFLIDLAVAGDRRELVDSTLAELESLEGADGPIRTLARVIVSLPEVRKIEDKASRSARVRELRDLTETVRKQRQGWGRVYVVLGRLDELDGLNTEAVEKYTRALDLGDRDEAVIRRTVDLLREQKQDAAAAGVLDRLASRIPLPDDLERYRAIYEMLNSPVPRAQRAVIDRIAPAASKDYKILLLRGSLLATVPDDTAALESFRAAVAIASPPVPEAFEAVVGQLVRTGRTDDAKSAVAEAEKLLRPDDQKTPAAVADLYLALARMHEAVGDLKTAEARYTKAVEVARRELTPHRRLAEFLMRTGRRDEVDRRLAALAETAGADVARWARRYRAQVVILTRANAYEHRKEALALIQQNLDANPNDPEDVKARAVVQTLDPVTREEGVRSLVGFWNKGELTPDEAYLLGRLTFDLGPSKFAESVKYFESAARPRPGLNLEHLAELVRVYLALSNLTLAEQRLERLKTIAPRSWQAVREEARVLKRKSREALLRADRIDADNYANQARKLILGFPGHDATEFVLTSSGPLLEELGFAEAAATLYKKLLTTWNSPAPHLPLAVLYLRDKKPREAISLAREYEKKAPVLVTAQILTGAVRVGRQGEAVEREIADWLDTRIGAYAGKPERVGLLGAKAELLDAQGRYTEAIAQYRRAIAEGSSPTVTNNLAMLLALHDKKADEAIGLMTDLIDVRGPGPAFLDTRAVAYLVKGGDAVGKAIEDLRMALSQRVTAGYLFHLAWAYELQGRRTEWEKHVYEARQVGITPADVHPLELKKYSELIGEYKK